MMRKALATAAVLALAFAAPVLAETAAPQQKGPNFEQRKAEILKNIELRLAGLQEEKACVAAAKGPEDLKVCMEKRREAMQKMRGDAGRRGGPRTPGRPMNPQTK